MNFRMIKTIFYSFILIQSILVAQTDSLKLPNQYSMADTVKGIEFFNAGKSYIDRGKYDSSITMFRKVEEI